MRLNQTEPERCLWHQIRRSQLGNHKFRRQAVIGHRIVDFFCPAKGLVVEIDGDTHDSSSDAVADELMLRRYGYATVRYSNHEVMTNLDGVLQDLSSRLWEARVRWATSASTTPQPPPLKRRGGDVADAIRHAAENLSHTSGTARLDAELLMAHALGVSRSDMLLRHMRDDAPSHFPDLVARRAAHEPIAHILGEQEFFGRVFKVTPDTLIPRGDSEVLIDAALELKPNAERVLDLGTGTGALLLTFLAETDDEGGSSGVGLDKSRGAIAVAQENAARLGMADRVSVQVVDWTLPGWADDLGQFDLILCNPPYVETAAELDPDVRDFEPHSALFAGPDGLDDYRILLPQIGDLLTSDGIAIFEIGANQGGDVTEIARESGFSSELRRDLAGRPRALICS